ncbi:polysaccharide biosynthesis/export family protein [Afifella pfennigii]|uniref:polysaccharide biosynthesis/export family protein n=1 Tax=Afifella pfennigii TaxID=209897 RepID=UPI0005524441|nr:polysaccharide biosynthesis/export family protein [Afifella pfennigii]
MSRDAFVVIAGVCFAASLSVTGAAAQQSLERASQLPAKQAVTGQDQPGCGNLGPGDHMMVTIYQREDLSRVYQVRADGRISFPTIGELDVQGKSVQSFEQLLAQRLEAVWSRPVHVSAEISERRPLFVIGEVDRPGSYPYTPGITVLQAVALSGGFFRPGVRAGNTIEVTREAARLGQARAELKRALTRFARLEAEQAQSAMIEVPQRLRQLATNAEIDELIAAERRIMEERGNARNSEIEGREAVLELLSEEITALEKKLESIAEQTRYAREEMAPIEQLSDRGLSPRSQLFTMQRVVANLEAEGMEVSARIARSKQNRAEIERAKALYKSTSAVSLQDEINATADKIAATELALYYSERILQDLNDLSGGETAAIAAPTMSYAVLRASGEKESWQQATQVTPLCPGDVLQVRFAGPGGSG